MSLELALNLVLAGLLVAVIVYAMRLHKRLGAWRDGKAELDRAATQFAKAAERAEAAVAELKMASEASGRLLEDQTRTALALKDDLEMLVARAAPAADQLLDRLQARPSAAPVAVPEPRAQMPASQMSGAPTSLGAAAARVPLRAAAAPVAASAPERAQERSPVRSMAEQELLRAIADRRKAATPSATQAGARGA